MTIILIIDYFNNELNHLRKYINSKEIHENENPKKVADNVEKILNFDKQQKGKGLPSDLARLARISYCTHVKILKVHRRISRKWCFGKYFLCDKACQFSPLQGTPWRSYLKNPTTDDKFINKQVRLFIHQICV